MSINLDTAELGHSISPGIDQPKPRHRPLAGGLTDLSGGKLKPRAGIRLPREIRRLYGPLGLLVVWSILSATHVLGPRVFPPPWSVVTSGIDLTRSGVLQEHLWASLQRVIAGF